jgi:hypothetical protein
MPHDAAGNRLFKRVDIKIFFPKDTMPVQKISQRAPAGKGFSADNIDEILMQVADQLDTRFPWWDFSYVELAPVGRTAAFRFNCVGYRKDYKVPPEVTELGKRAAETADIVEGLNGLRFSELPEGKITSA